MTTDTVETKINQFPLKVPKEVLQEMIIYNSPLAGKSVLELSRKYKVMVVLLRHIGCIFCRYAVYQISKIYKALLQCNIIPVFVHAEKKDVANQHFASYEGYKPVQPVAQKIFRVEDPTGEFFYNYFEVGNTSVAKMLVSLPKILKNKKMVEDSTGLQNVARDKYAKRVQAYFFVEKEVVSSAYYYVNFTEAMDVGNIISHPSQIGCTSEFCSSGPLQDMIEDTGLFGEFLDSLNMASPRIAKSPRSRLACFAQQPNEMDFAPDFSITYSIGEVLEHDVMRKYFKSFALKECSIENILMYEECNKYKSLEKMEERVSEIKSIYNKFIRPSSHLQVNLGADTLRKLEEKMETEGENPDYFFFEEVVTILTNTNLRDTYSRFQKSPMYAEMLEAVSPR